MPSTSSINRLMRPNSIAIVGASPRTRMGMAIIRNARAIGLKGPILPINPNYREIDGLPCYPSLRELPESPDCVIVIVPATAVLSVIEEAGAQGVRAAIVVANGFADARTDAGRERQRRLVELASAHDMAIAGPNCLGLSSLVYRFANTYTDLPEHARAGGISIISQSGGLLNAAAFYAADRCGGLNYLISGGNHAVMDIPAYIDFLADDPATKVIACIMEGVGDGRRFRDAIERTAPRKPIVVLKLGRSETGQRATMAHTGTLAGSDEAYAALFRQNGVAQAASIDDLMETAMVMATAKRPGGDGVAMLTISGGTTGLIADLGEAAGLRFPKLSDATNRQLCEIFGTSGHLDNPIDTTGWPQLSDAGNVDRLLDALLGDSAVDLVAIVFRLTTGARDQRLLGDLARRAAEADKPVVFASTVSYTAQPFRLVAPELMDFTIAEDLENAQRAVARLIAYGLYRKRVEGGARSVMRRQPPKKERFARATLTEYESKAILAEFGLPVTRETLATTPDEAAAGASAIGFPVAIKIQSPDVPHKSDAGGVLLNIRAAHEAREAFAHILDNVRKCHPAATIDGVLVQEMALPGVEIILGMTNDSQLGPLVVCGLGGVMVELLKDVSVRFPPFDEAVAREMLAELRGAPLLNGYRGAPPCDVDALVAALVVFADMIAQTDGRFAAIDINPLIVGARGEGARIADALIIPADQ